MTNNMKEHFKNEKGEFESIFVTALLFKHKWLIILTVFFATAASVVVSFMLPVWYRSTTNVVPPQTEDTGLSSALSGLSGALKDFGLTQLGGVGGDTYTFMVILESRTVLDSIIKKYDLAKEYDIPYSEMDMLREAFRANVSITYEKQGNYIISVWSKDPKKAADMANEYVQIANELSVKVFRQEKTISRKHLENRIAVIDSNLVAVGDSLEVFSRDNMMFAPEEQARAVSLALADLKANKIQTQIIYDYYKNNYGEDYPYTSLYKSLLTQTTNQVEQALEEPGYAGDFSIRDASSVTIKYMKYYTEFETYSRVKAFLLPMLEEARLDETKQIKNLFVVDEAIPALKKDRPRKSIIVAGTFIASFVFIVVLILGIYSFKNFNNKFKKIKDSI